MIILAKVTFHFFFCLIVRLNFINTYLASLPLTEVWETMEEEGLKARHNSARSL